MMEQVLVCTVRIISIFAYEITKRFNLFNKKVMNLQDNIKSWRKLNMALRNLDVRDGGKNPFEWMTMMRMRSLSQRKPLGKVFT
jgi:hypothetical protein